MFHSVKGDEGSSLRHGLDHNLIASHHVGIKAVQGLTVGHHDIVGDVYNIINRTQAHGIELGLQPLWTFLHLTAGNAHTGIAAAGLCVLNHHVDGQVMVGDDKIVT